jgi:hypothetical protein
MGKNIAESAKAVIAETKALEAQAKSLIDVAKDGLNILRDLVLLGLFVLLLHWPGQFKALLNRAGIKEVDAGFFKWQQDAVAEAATQNKKAAEANGNASVTLQAVQGTLDTIVSTSSNPDIRKKAQDAADQVKDTLTTLGKAGDSLNQSLVAQQKVLASAGQNGQPASAVPIATQGWIYLGKVDTSHGNWVDPPKPATTLASPKLTAGETITLSKDVSLHDNKAPGQTSFNQAAVLAAVPGGSTATVVGFDYSKALGGGDFLWARVVVSSTH